MVKPHGKLVLVG